MIASLLFLAVIALFGQCQTQLDENMWENRNTIVQLFEWKWNDIADECENFLQHQGYGGVQVSPPNENVIIPNRPWWERYQPISYILITRSGNETEFSDMVRRCNDVGVRIYVDVVISHMTARMGTVRGTGGSVAYTDIQYYPAVPYTAIHFHPICYLNDNTKINEARNCELLNTLNQGIEHVRFKLVDFMNRLIDLGVAGFRVEASTSMWPSDLESIFNRLNNLNTDHGFDVGSRPFIVLEVIDLGGKDISRGEYLHLGRITEYKFSAEIDRIFKGNGQLAHLSKWGEGRGCTTNPNPLVFVDNHVNQRGYGLEGNNILTYKESKQYRMAIAFLLAHPYGSTRIMSSFAFTDIDMGPPQDAGENIISPGINADGTCSNGWVCEHRWRQIANMIAFRNAVRGTGVNDWWSNGDQQIAFCRGGNGFIAVTNGGTISQTMQTCLPSGTYCDVISGSLINGQCTGKIVTVGANGLGHVQLADNEEDGVLAIHINARI